jgi:excisionase family DNA binding protein
MLMEDSRLIGTTETAELLGVDRATVTRWARSGKLAATKLAGRNGPYLFTRVSVAHLAAQRRNGRGAS